MDTDKLVEQLLRGAALPELLSELPYATAVSVTERLQQEAERYWVIDPRRSLEFADRIVAIGQARADPRQSALGLMARGDALKFMGQEVEAWEAFQLARNMLLAPGEEVGRAQALISSLSQLLAQRHANLQAQARVGAESDSAISLQRLLLRINSRIAHLYKQINDHFQAQARVEAESDSAISLQRLLLRIDLRIANLYKQMGDHLQAVHHYQTAIATAEALGENQYLTSLYMNLGLTYIGLGDAPQALANLERARRTLSITGNQKIETEACHNARKSLKDMLLGRVLESDELHQAEAHVVTCPFCQLRLQLLAMEILMHPEGNCSIWRDRLHDYVEAQLAGHEENPEFMELRRHLDTCVDCAEVYALLYETMWAEQQGAIPELLTMPTLDTSFLSSKAAADPSQHELLDRLPNDYQTDGPSYRMRARSQLNTYMQQNPQRKRVSPVVWRFSIAFVTVVLLFLATGTAFAQQALPGDTLYNWKLTSEHLWRFTLSDQLGYDIALSNRRMNELLVVSGDETRRAWAIQNYEKLLVKFQNAESEQDRARILPVLRAQQQALLEAGVIIPELESYFPP